MSTPSPHQELGPGGHGALGSLTALVRRLERDGQVRPASGAGGQAPAAVATGWAGLDGRLGTFEGAAGLARGALHEWVGLVDGAPQERPARGPWSPPLTVLAHLAARALEERLARGGGREPSGSVLWIGRAVWPYAATLLASDVLAESLSEDTHEEARAFGLELALDERPCPTPAAERALFARSLFIDPADAASRLWAIDAALRCPTVTAVVADGTGLDMAASRRLALAANTGEALTLIARPPWEERALSAAATRWRVERVGDSVAPGWRLTLLRAKPPQQRRGS